MCDGCRHDVSLRGSSVIAGISSIRARREASQGPTRMPDTLPIDLGRYSVFVPPDPFEDHVGPFYFRIARRCARRRAACIACCRPQPRHGNYAGGVHGGATLTFADYALCLVAGRAADGGTNTSFAMTVSIAVEFLDAGRIGAAARGARRAAAGDRPPRLRARQHHPGGPHDRAVVGRVPPRGARQGDGAQGRGGACPEPGRAADRAGGLRAAGQCQRLFPPHRPVLRAQGVGRRVADPADPAAHVQFGRRAAWRLHDELCRFGGDARRGPRHRHGAQHGGLRRRVPGRRRCHGAAHDAGRGAAPRQVARLPARTAGAGRPEAAVLLGDDQAAGRAS